MFFILVAESQLKCRVTIALFCSYLRNHAGTCFDNGASGLLARRIEDAGHPNFFSDNTFHFLTVYPRKVVQDRPQKKLVFNPGSSLTFSFVSPAFADDRSTSDKQTSKGLFLC